MSKFEVSAESLWQGAGVAHNSLKVLSTLDKSEREILLLTWKPISKKAELDALEPQDLEIHNSFVAIHNLAFLESVDFVNTTIGRYVDGSLFDATTSYVPAEEELTSEQLERYNQLREKDPETAKMLDDAAERQKKAEQEVAKGGIVIDNAETDKRVLNAISRGKNTLSKIKNAIRRDEKLVSESLTRLIDADKITHQKVKRSVVYSIIEEDDTLDNIPT